MSELPTIWAPLCADGNVHGMFEHRWTRESVEAYVAWLDRPGADDPGCGPHRAAEFGDKAEIDRLRAEVRDWEASFDLYHRADMRGIEMWRAEAPAERELIRPDKGNLVAWLLGRLDAAEAERNRLREAARETIAGEHTSVTVRERLRKAMGEVLGA